MDELLAGYGLELDRAGFEGVLENVFRSRRFKDLQPGNVGLLVVHNNQNLEQMEKFLNVLSNEMAKKVKRFTGYDLQMETHHENTVGEIKFEHAVSSKALNADGDFVYTLVSLALKSNSSLNSNTVRSHARSGFHEIFHALFEHDETQLLSEEFLADAFSARLSSKKCVLQNFKKSRDMGQPMDETDPYHPSLSDRIKAIKNDTYSSSIDKILELVSERVKQGDKWSGMLKDKSASDFIER